VPGLRDWSASERHVLAAKGSAWSLAGYGASQVLRLATTLILARQLLSPKAFGLVALANVFLSGLEVLSDIGTGMNVVQHLRGDDPGFLDTAFCMQACRGLALWVLAISLAFPFAAIYHQPQVRMLVIVGASTLAIRGVTSSSVWLMTRHVDLRKLTMLNVLGDGSGLVVTIAWAFASPTAWALVAGKVVTALAFTVGSHLFAERRVRARWDRAAARDILIFGTGMFLSSATYFFSGESERLVVGKFISITELGCFSLALVMASAPLGALQRLISQVFFPMISETFRHNPRAAARHCRTLRLLLSGASIIIGVGFLTCSGLAVRLLLRPEYAMTAWMLRLLGLRAALELFGSGAAVMLFAVGRSKYAAIGNTVKLAFLMGGLFLAFHYFGFRQAMWVLAAAPLPHYLAQMVGLNKYVKPVVRTELACFAGFAVTVLVVAFFRRMLI